MGHRFLNIRFPLRVEWIDLEVLVCSHAEASAKIRLQTFYFYLFSLVLFPSSRKTVSLVLLLMVWAYEHIAIVYPLRACIASVEGRSLVYRDDETKPLPLDEYQSILDGLIEVDCTFDRRPFYLIKGSYLKILQPTILCWKYRSSSRKELLMKMDGLVLCHLQDLLEKATSIAFLPLLLKGDHRRAEVLPTAAASTFSPNREPSSVEEAQDMLARAKVWLDRHGSTSSSFTE
ncbi:hypothetical protein AMTR_s00009p00211980 [Amborella trichopoda]|uniref:Uncharacterized protein n=1 Tax=Amborella trichopoda TaxID=13333 RepID=W1NIE8_AMBTC|nr:hypothetical protein AMTR_s00009p00211980 [Amborella trichopoda]